MRLWFESALLEGGWEQGVAITLEEGLIARIETGAARAPGESAHGPALPGLCNVHSHAFQRAIAGRTEVRGPAGDNFWTWREQMYASLDRLDPEGTQIIAALAYVEMLESGFTRVGEFHYVHNAPDGGAYADPAAMAEAIGAAADETGIALTLLPVFYAHSDFGGKPPTRGQRRFVTSLDAFARIHARCGEIAAALPGANVGVAPHSLRAVTPEQLRHVAALGGPVHIHAAEQTGEVDACLAWSGKRPVEWLLDHGAGEGWCLVHATHLTEAECDALAKSGAVAGLCPVTEANLGDGIFPTPRFLAAGGAFGVGTDSNVAIDAAHELRMLEYVQRLVTRSRNVLAAGEGASTGTTLFAGAHAGGTRALGVSGEGIAVDAPADIVSLKPGGSVDGWIFAGARDHIDCVWRGGAQLVTGGRHVARDAIERRYAANLGNYLG